MTNEGIELEVYSYQDYGQKIGTIRARKSPKFLDELKSFGAGTFQVPRNDSYIKSKPHLLKSRNLIKYRVNGHVVAAWLIKARRTRTVTLQGKNQEVYEVSGIGLKQWFDDAEVRPYGGLKSNSKDTRSFSFSSEAGDWYIPSQWTDVVRNQKVGSKAQSYAPSKWPDSADNARWVWGTPYNAGGMPFGDNYFRITLPVSSPAEYVIYLSVDDFYQLYVDGELIASNNEVGAYHEAKRINLGPLTAGTHVIGILGTTYKNKAGLAAAIYRVKSLQTEEALGTSTITIANPATVTKTAHGLSNGSKVFFRTTGSLPGGLSQNTNYYVRDVATNTFRLAKSKDGPAIATSGAQSGTHTLWTAEIPETTTLVTYSGMSVSELDTLLDQANATMTLRLNTYNSLPAGDKEGNNTQKKQAKAKAAARAIYFKAKQDRDALQREYNVAVAADAAGITWKVQAYPAQAPGWSPGEILVTLIDEAVARGVLGLSYLTPSFTSTEDSYGNPWPAPVDWEFKVGESLLSVLKKLEELSCDVWIDPDTLQLHMVAERGVDRSTMRLDTSEPGELLRTNLAPVPLDGPGWSVHTDSQTYIGTPPEGVATARMASRLTTGGATAIYTHKGEGNRISLEAGKTYTISAWVFNSLPNPTMNLRLASGDGTTGPSKAIPWNAGLAGKWAIFSDTYTVDTTGEYNIALLWTNGGIGNQYGLTAVTVLEGTPPVVTPFTGDTGAEGTKLYSWTGTENRSSSVEVTYPITQGPVIFRPGKNLREADIESQGKIKNSLSIKTAIGWLSGSYEDEDSINEYGVIEGSIDTGTTAAMSRKLADIIFSHRAQEEEGASYDVYITRDGKIPWVDFFPGDWVLAPNEEGILVKRRIMSISLEETTSGQPYYTLEFDTVFESNEKRVDTVLKKLGGGGVGGSFSNASGIGTPSPNAPTTTDPIDYTDFVQVPETPQDLEIFSVGYWSSNGVNAQSQVDITWSPVTEYTDSTEMVPSHYEVWGRPSDETEDSYVLVGTATEPMITAQPFNAGGEWTFRIRAVDKFLRQGEFSEEIAHVMSGPTDPMLAPSMPSVTSELGLLIVGWDGLIGGSTPPPQFRYVYAEVASAEAGPWVRRGPTLARDGRQITIPGESVGQQRWARLVAVDGVGIASEPSASASITIQGVDLGDLAQDVADAIEAAQSAADAAQSDATDAAAAAAAAGVTAGNAQSAADTAQATANNKNKAWYQATMPAGTDHKLGDIWFDTDDGYKIYTWDGNSWEVTQDSAGALSAAATAQADADQAIEDAIAAATAAANAQTAANNAQTTANGKNKVVRSSSTPSGTGFVLGDQWWRYSGSQIIGLWIHDGTNWVAQTLTSAVLTNIDAGIITAGTLDAARIAAKSITAEKLLIGDMEDKVVDPYFRYSNQPIIGGTPKLSTDAGVPASSPYPTLLQVSAVWDGFIGDWFPVSPGDKFYVEAWVANPAGSTNLLLGLWTADTPVYGGNSFSYPQISTAPAAARTWTKVSGTITVPALGNNGAAAPAYARVRFSSANSSGWFVTGYHVRRMNGGELIVDGAITATKIATGAITAGSAIIADGAITSAKIGDAQVTNAKIADATIQSAKIAALDAAKITAGTLNAARIAAGSLSTQKLAVGNFYNLLEDPSFEQDVTTFWNNASANVTKVTTNPRTGARALRIRAQSAAYEATRHQAPIPVEGGEEYIFGAWIRGETATTVNRAIELSVAYGVDTGAMPSTYAIVTSPENLGTTYTYFYGSWVVPNGTKFVRPRLIVRNDLSNANAYLIDDLTFYRRIPGQLIVDGAITTGKIGADQIVAEHIQAEAIATYHLQAAAITAEKVAAEAITAEAIASDSIQANHIQAGAIETNHISPAVGNELDISANTSINFLVGEVGAVQDNVDATSGELQTMQTFYQYGPEGAVISSPGDVYALALRNDRIDMLENGNVVSYWNSGQMYVDQLVATKLTMGNHQIEKYGSGTVVRDL